MHLAVAHGAMPNQTFKQYVTHLETSGYGPPGTKPWLDRIRERGNEATHELPEVGEEEARQLLVFTESLLVFMYELPAQLTAPAP